ncbi:unnamed protein product [Pleuronectes platessa]|uniref:Uncharacterized protein n=1 Tax=Pleuronectes platessa TaxID=8262 RepID=A0A9N7Z8V5_PLEPL|nr:unnamed protein product [Pleuronectes platessa]
MRSSRGRSSKRHKGTNTTMSTERCCGTSRWRQAEETSPDEQVVFGSECILGFTPSRGEPDTSLCLAHLPPPAGRCFIPEITEVARGVSSVQTPLYMTSKKHNPPHTPPPALQPAPCPTQTSPASGDL